MLTRAYLLIQHLFVNLMISTTSAGAICFRERNEHEEVDDEAGDDDLDQRRNH